MKRSSLFILAFLFQLSLAAAIETSLKQTYPPGETMIISLEGNFIEPLTSESISFYSGRIQIPLLSGIAKIEEKYYLYALLQSQARNYSLKIKNAHFIENGLEETRDLEFNFSVSGNITDFSIDPGLVVTGENFSIKIQSKSKTLTVNAKVQNTNLSKSLSVPAGQTKSFSFLVSEFPSAFSFLEISSENTKYMLPVKITSLRSAINQTTNKTSMEFSQKIINITALKNVKTSFTLLLKNTGDIPLENISLSTINTLEITPKSISLLEPGNSKEFNLTIILGDEQFFARVTAQTPTAFAEIPIYATATENESEVVLPPKPELESCELLGGKICKAEEICKGDLVNSRDSKCCKGACEKQKIQSNTGRYIAIGVIALIILLIIFFAVRKSRTKKKEFKDILEKRTKDYEQKINPHPEPSEEVKGKLTKT